jgi:hypothetical protein
VEEWKEGAIVSVSKDEISICAIGLAECGGAAEEEVV